MVLGTFIQRWRIFSNWNLWWNHSQNVQYSIKKNICSDHMFFNLSVIVCIISMDYSFSINCHIEWYHTHRLAPIFPYVFDKVIVENGESELSRFKWPIVVLKSILLKSDHWGDVEGSKEVSGGKEGSEERKRDHLMSNLQTGSYNWEECISSTVIWM